MFSWIKKAAVNAVGSYAKDCLTVGNITKWILDAVNDLLVKATKDVDAEKMAKVCETAAKVSAICGTLSKALSDKSISQEEAQKILAEVKDAIGTSGITDKTVSDAVDRAVEAIKARI